MDLTEILTSFARDGYARLGQLAGEDTLAALRQRADDLMLGKLSYDGLFFQRDTETNRYEDLEYGNGWQGPSLNYRKVEKLEADPLFHAWINHAAFAEIAASLIGGEVVIYRALLMNKSAQGGSDLPWHQDGGKFWGVDRPPKMQVWTALDDAPAESGCVEVLPGSHLAGLVTPMGGVVPADRFDAAATDARAVKLPVAAGEALLIHNHVWHRFGREQHGQTTRRAFTVCYMSAETRCLRKKRSATEVFFPVFR